MTNNRCRWANSDPLYIDYHDNEWGKPLYDDQQLFEFLMLEGMQAGLSWITILKKRPAYREAFDNFNAKKIIDYDADKVASLLQNPGIIRNRLKVNAIINNAKCYLDIKKSMSFRDYIWQFVDNKPIINQWSNINDIPATTLISDHMAKNLKKKGFKFVGSTICYAFMQAAGLVNDHVTDCFCYSQKNN